MVCVELQSVGTRTTIFTHQVLTIPDSGTSASQFILQDSASTQTVSSALTLNGNVSVNGQITLSPPLSGNLSSVSLTGTANAAFSVRSLLLGFVSTVGTFLSDSGVSNCVIRNGVSNAAVRIGFGAGSASSVVINSSRSTFNNPATITGSSTHAWKWNNYSSCWRFQDLHGRLINSFSFNLVRSLTVTSLAISLQIPSFAASQ